VQLPALNTEQLAQLAITEQVIKNAIAQAGGRIPFDRFMELALYAPGAGYYVNGKRKLGAQGDFVTAPEISAVFSQCLAAQCAQVLAALGDADVLEFGAGSGVMAADMLLQLERMDSLPRRYLILELSPDLQVLQRETLALHAPHLLTRVSWLDRLPEKDWSGVVVANELLDAMPVHRFRAGAGGYLELFVELKDEVFVESWGSVQSPALSDALNDLETRRGSFEDGYSSEVNLRLLPWLQAVANSMQQGAVILADYGYAEREYYHPERVNGTLICHYQHKAFDAPLKLSGLQDITANVDFTAVARAALEVGFELAGYTSQTHFLIDTGLDECVSAADQSDVAAFMQLVQGVKVLTLPSEMGERFKFIGLAKNLDLPLRGFTSRDMREYL